MQETQLKRSDIPAFPNIGHKETDTHYGYVSQSLPSSAEGLIEVDHRDTLVAHGIAQAELGVKVGTLGVEQVNVADGTVDVLQLGQIGRASCRERVFVPV